MPIRPHILFIALAAFVFCGNAGASPLDDLGKASVSALDFGSFRLEVALTVERDWPQPIEGASVSYRLDPARMDIVVAVANVRADAYRSVCERTFVRLRKLLYVNADGTAPMGRSNLGAYFPSPWRRDAREGMLRQLDAITRVRIDVVGRGSCGAPLVGAPVGFDPLAAK